MTERLPVKFNSRNQRLVVISATPEKGMKLERYVGLTKESEARIEPDELAREEITTDALKEVIEEFRITKPTVTRKQP